MMAIEQEKVVVIGAGPAGVEAAKAARLYSHEVTIISKGEIGDWSKLGWSAGIIEAMDQTHIWSELLVRAKRKLIEWSNTVDKDLAERGIKRTIGRATDINKKEVTVEISNCETLVIPYDKLFIAVGSSPYFPEGFKPDNQSIFSPHAINSLQTLPDSLLLIGNGPISYEYASIFHALGVKVKWLAPDEGPHTPFNSFIHTHLNRSFEQRGIEIVKGPFVKEIKKAGHKMVVTREDQNSFIGDKVFLSIGFRSNVDLLNVSALNLSFKNGEIVVDEYGQTVQSNVYIIGDAQSANSSSLSMHQARRSVIHSFDSPRLKDYSGTPPIVFNYSPQVGVIGRPDVNDSSYTVSIKPRRFKKSTNCIEDETVKLTFDQSGNISSAIVIGAFASEMINLIAMAINFQIKIDKLAHFYASHPSYNEVMLTVIREIEYKLKADSKY